MIAERVANRNIGSSASRASVGATDRSLDPPAGRGACRSCSRLGRLGSLAIVAMTLSLASASCRSVDDAALPSAGLYGASEQRKASRVDGTMEASLAAVAAQHESASELPTGSDEGSRSMSGPGFVVPNANLRRLTEPGCCTQPFWSADGRRVMFVDRPSPDAAVGIWAVDVDAPESPPQLVTEDLAGYNPDTDLRVERTDGGAIITRLADGEAWTIATGGASIAISPDRSRVAWSASPDGVPSEQRVSKMWVADLDGTNAREIAEVPRSSFAGWLTDDTLLVRGRESLESPDDVLWALDANDGSTREIARSASMRGQLPSPDGRWVAYYVSRLPDSERTGTWIASAAGGSPRKIDPTLFGAYRWRDGSRLLIVPMALGAATHELIELDAATWTTRRLTDPASTPFTIANGDWAVSPDGSRVAFVEDRDKAIWVIDLPTTR